MVKMAALKRSNKVVVIGLDGATFDLILPLVERGKLPTFKKLIKKGTHGRLKSCIPPLTSPAWKCYSTGKNPGKLGVSGYYSIDFGKRTTTYVNSTSFRSEEIWDILARNNLKSIVYNMPLTFPVKRMNGIMVSGIDTPINAVFTFPKDVMNELRELLRGYEPWKTISDIFLHRSPLNLIRGIIRQRFLTMEHLAKNYEWDFFHGTIFYCDSIQHYMWKNRQYLNILWSTIDEELAKFLQNTVDENTYLFIMSDHGFGPAKGIIRIDQYLKQYNHLKYKTEIPLFLNRILEKTSYAICKIERLIPTRDKNLYEKDFLIWSMRKTSNLLFKLLDKDLEPDWEKSRIIVFANGISASVYINRNLVSSKNEIVRIKSEIVSDLRNTISLNVHDREEIYEGNQVKYCPDLIITSKNNEYLLRDSKSRSLVCFRSKGYQLKWKATHRAHGIFIAFGPDIEKNNQIAKPEIFDLAPTILHIFNVPIPRDLDGKVLRKAFSPGTDLYKRKLTLQKPRTFEAEKTEKILYEEEIRKRLRDLGYI